MCIRDSINNIQDAIVAIEHELGKNPSGDYATVRERLDSITPGGRWQLVEEAVLTSAVQSYTFSNLDGDSDEEYLLDFRIRSQHDYTANYILRFNGDEGGNYDWQRLMSHSSTTESYGYSSDSGIRIVRQMDGPANILFGQALIFAKSGYLRTVMAHSECYWATGGNIWIFYYGGNWRNTEDNITSITLRSTSSVGLGVDTILRLYKKA